MSKFITPANIYLPGYYTLFCTMKKLILTLTIIIASVFNGYSQEEDMEHPPLYLTFTSKTGYENIGNGVYRNFGDEIHPFISRPINYTYQNADSNVSIFLIYVELDLEYRKRDMGGELQYDDSLTVATYPIKFMEENNFIDVDELFSGMSKEEIWEIVETWRGKRIYIVDKNPDFGEITDDSVKVTQVKCLGTNRPPKNDDIIRN